MAPLDDPETTDDLGEASPDSVIAPEGFTTKDAKKRSSLFQDTHGTSAHPGEYVWDCAKEFAEMSEQLDLEPALNSEACDFVLGGLCSNNSKATDFLLWTVDGFICSRSLLSADVQMLETHIHVPRGSLFKLYCAATSKMALRKLPHELRGAKTTEHLKILRTSDPCFSSLTPDLTRPNKTELSYCPQNRWAAMPKERKVKGAKSMEHLEILRTSDPSYGTLAPSRTRKRPTIVRLDSIGSLENFGGWQDLQMEAAGGAVEAEVSPAALPDVEWPEEESDDDQLGEDLPNMSLARHRRVSRPSCSDSDGMSAARTAERDRNEPRESNDTIASFMEDSSEGHLSGEWPVAYAFSPKMHNQPKSKAAAAKHAGIAKPPPNPRFASYWQ